MLKVRNLTVRYGKHLALNNVSIDMAKGETVVILGANGAGKSSLLKTLAGLVMPDEESRITLNDNALAGLPAHKIVEQGLALAPEGRGIFPPMTVAENLRLGANPARARAGEAAMLDEVYDLFPRLKERRRQVAGTMSGGEQQMVAIGRALMSAPDILLLDEPSLGLAPVLVSELFQTLAKIGKTGVGLLIVEQNVRTSLAIADRGYLLEAGEIKYSGTAAALMNDPLVQSTYLGVTA